MHQLMTDLHEGTRKALPCGAGFGMLAVDKDGGLNLCHRFTGSKLPTFGDVDNGLDKALGDFLEKRRTVGTGCATCRIRNLCSGGCYHESYAHYGDPTHPCALLRTDARLGRLRHRVYARIMAGNPGFFHPSLATPPRGHSEGDLMKHLKPLNEKAALLEQRRRTKATRCRDADGGGLHVDPRPGLGGRCFRRRGRACASRWRPTIRLRGPVLVAGPGRRHHEYVPGLDDGAPSAQPTGASSTVFPEKSGVTLRCSVRLPPRSCCPACRWPREVPPPASPRTIS